MKHAYFNRYFILVILAFFVVLLGAYTRLSDAGLGCPDWPGCYGHWVVPTHAANTMDASKAWKEMIHRYAAGTLASGILVLCLFSWIKRKKIPRLSFFISLLLAGLIVFQAALGMWTVTQKLQPLVVMGHLLGGLATLSLLFWYALTCNSSPHKQTIPKAFAILGLLLLIVQIMLGGWTSANYAALACPDFPGCFQQLPMRWDFNAAFSLWTPVGHMTAAGLATIQMVHRIWGAFTGTYLLLLACTLFFQPRFLMLGIFLLLLVSLQVTLGILNVIWLLPMSTALPHNAVAALLLLTLIRICNA